jgi:hypothetical protein
MKLLRELFHHISRDFDSYMQSTSAIYLQLSLDILFFDTISPNSFSIKRNLHVIFK